MLNKVRAVPYWLVKSFRRRRGEPVLVQLDTGVRGAIDRRGRRVRVGVVDTVGLDVQRRRHLDGLVDVVRRREVRLGELVELVRVVLQRDVRPELVPVVGDRVGVARRVGVHVGRAPTAGLARRRVAGPGGFGARVRVDTHDPDRDADRRAVTFGQRGPDVDLRVLVAAGSRGVVGQRQRCPAAPDRRDRGAARDVRPGDGLTGSDR